MLSCIRGFNVKKYHIHVGSLQKKVIYMWVRYKKRSYTCGFTTKKCHIHVGSLYKKGVYICTHFHKRKSMYGLENEGNSSVKNTKGQNHGISPQY